MSPEAARVVEAFRDRFDRAPELLVRAPGRVALLGAHVDYSDGWVLPAAIDRAVWLAAARAPVEESGRPQALRLVALDLPPGDREARLALDRLPPPRPARERDADGDADSDASPAWLDLPAGVAHVLTAEVGSMGPAGSAGPAGPAGPAGSAGPAGPATGGQLPGLDVVFGGDLPRGAGLSSSAAVEVAFLLAWRAVDPRVASLDRRRLAALGRRVENEYLGVGSGVMDQYASLHGRDGHALLLDCRSLEHELLPLPDDLAVLVADSGVRRRLAGSGFDDRRRQCAEAVERLRPYLVAPDDADDADDRIRALRDVSVEALELHAHRLPPTLRRRAWHAVHEMARVRAAADDLRHGDLERFGRRMRASHAGSRDLYEVSIPELDVLAASAWSADGCLGARLTGGGFGGCVVALVRREAADAVADSMRRGFDDAFARRPVVHRVTISGGASVEPLVSDGPSSP